MVVALRVWRDKERHDKYDYTLTKIRAAENSLCKAITLRAF